MKKRIYRVLILIVLLILGFSIVFEMNRRNPEELIFSEEYVPMSEVLGELVFVPYEEEDWEELLKGYEDNVLTKDQVGTLLDYLGIAEYIDWKDEIQGKNVTRAEWNAIYQKIREYLDTEQAVQEKTVMILEIIPAEDGCVLITNEGEFLANFQEKYLVEWKNYTLYLEGEKCLGIAGVSEESVRLYNAFQKEVTETELVFLYHGSEYRIEVNGLEKTGNQVCDLEFQNGVLVKKYEKQDTIEGELLSYDDQGIEISGYGRIAHEGKLPVYQIYGEIQEKSLSDIVLGNMKAKYVVAGEEVCAILLEEPADIQKIRVLLLAENNQLGRDTVHLKVSEESIVRCGTNEGCLPAGAVLHVTDYGLNENGQTLSIESVSGTGTISFCDETGAEQGNPYAGKLEIRYEEEGYTVINELPLEEYLYAVVPSEMPSSYGLEALKAQAVCARSYAYIQLLKADYAAYGAHIDDSTSYQVYNKSGKTEQSVQAVDETIGQVMTYGEKVIEAYYFSTSSGYTDMISVWNKEDDGTYGYLRKVCLNKEEFPKNLSEEENFREFIRSTPEGYECGVKFFRWNLNASFSGKEEELASVLKTRKGIAPENILYYNRDGSLELEEMDSFGKIKSLTVTERSESGSILNLRLQYENGIVDVKTEYNIRRILAVGAGAITFADGSETEMTILPSAFCAVIPLENGSYKIYGGGYGHGLGMSQNGANGLASEGKGYQEILEYFYQGITLENIYEKEE
ncbi:MAG: SpoIID/LytB domain-containing protein [Roseburia sp.]